jgi:hypothetical protein
MSDFRGVAVVAMASRRRVGPRRREFITLFGGAVVAGPVVSYAPIDIRSHVGN